MRSLWIGLVTVCAASTTIDHARAGLNDPISFSQPGTVSLTLDLSSGGFDHILELANTLGPVGTPLMALTNTGSSPNVLGYTPANIGDTVPVGSFSAGAEIVFRLTNVGSARFGTPDEIDSQVFSGTASSLNPNPTNYFTYIDFLDATTIRVYFEDIIGVSPSDADPINKFFNDGYDAAFTLTLSPVPEPTSIALASLALCVLLRRHR